MYSVYMRYFRCRQNKLLYVVNGVAPSGTATDMAKFKSGDRMLHSATPSMRLADPNEIANVIISDGEQILQYGNNRE